MNWKPGQGIARIQIVYGEAHDRNMFLWDDLIETLEESVELWLDRRSQPVLSDELNILVLVLVSDKNVSSIRLEVHNDSLAQLGKMKI